MYGLNISYIPVTVVIFENLRASGHGGTHCNPTFEEEAGIGSSGAAWVHETLSQNPSKQKTKFYMYFFTLVFVLKINSTKLNKSKSIPMSKYFL